MSSCHIKRSTRTISRKLSEVNHPVPCTSPSLFATMTRAMSTQQPTTVSIRICGCSGITASCERKLLAFCAKAILYWVRVIVPARKSTMIRLRIPIIQRQPFR